ncbi:hypothetical protein NYE37_10615 [Thermoactinomyces sp. FSL K6-2592]|uniref:hypothetical protein n=1 Tax=Thermoactinomyces sp. FSL K6-2592 TaxID=2975347 RepID=UPI0030FCE02F
MPSFELMVTKTSTISSALLIGTTCILILYLLLQMSVLLEILLSGKGMETVTSVISKLESENGEIELKPFLVSTKGRGYHKWVWSVIGIGYGLGGLFMLLPVLLIILGFYVVSKYFVFKILGRLQVGRSK